MLITSRDNGRIKRIRSLRDRRPRERTGLYIIEGLRLIIEAIEVDADLECIIASPALLRQHPGPAVDRILRNRSIPQIEVTPEVFRTVAVRDPNQGVLAVARQHWESLQDVNQGSELCWVALNEIRYPGNLGTILRCSDAVGGAGAILIGRSTDPYDPAAVQASLGAVFTQRLIRCSPSELVEWKKKRGCTVVGTSPYAQTSYQSVSYAPPLVLLMGNENYGLTPELEAACDFTVRIPMAGRVDSHNVAAAASIVLYEIFNQRS